MPFGDVNRFEMENTNPLKLFEEWTNAFERSLWESLKALLVAGAGEDFSIEIKSDQI